LRSDCASRATTGRSGGDPSPPLSLPPTAYDFKPPRVDQWNVGVQHKLLEQLILDVAYVGSRSTDLMRQVQINALPFGATFLPQNQDPTLVPSAIPGNSALPNDLLRPYPGYGNIRMWDYSGYSDYKALQTSVTRRFRRRSLDGGGGAKAITHGALPDHAAILAGKGAGVVAWSSAGFTDRIPSERSKAAGSRSSGSASGPRSFDERWS